MAIDVPPGYVTRPTAAGLYNRSQRSLERDLDEAYKQNNLEVLAAFKLLTNDDPPRNATDVTTEIVESLKQNGKNPAWCISKSWLEETFGERGSPKPQPLRKYSSVPATQRVMRDEDEAATEATRAGDLPAASALSNDIDFLKERIRALEREKQQEIDRNREREAKLFEQLEVKDKQISAWDEITQGITKGLATGRLTPALSAGPVSETTRTKTTEPVAGDEIPTSQIIDAAVDSAHSSKATKQASSRRAEPSQREKTATTKAKGKPAQQRKKPVANSGGKTKSTKPATKKTTSMPKPEPSKRGLLSRLFSS